jgi:hypothetical protein
MLIDSSFLSIEHWMHQNTALPLNRATALALDAGNIVCA